MEPSDKQLIEIFLQGDEKAFETLLERYLKPVLNFIYQMAEDRHAAEDLTQITFIKVWKNLRKFNPENSFKTWLFAIARNAAYDYFKKKKNIPFSFFENDERENQLENIAEDEILPDEFLEKADAAEELEKALQKISSRYRIILLMRYKDDLSLSETAEILKVPYNTVKSRHQRGLLALKKLLKN